MAQLVEWSLPIPEICSLNPVIGKFYLLSNVFKTLLKRGNKVKEAGNGPFKKNHLIESVACTVICLTN